jgi:hypothetical protein
LLILPFFGTGGVQFFSVISDLQFAAHLDTVGITVMEQEFATSIPARVEIGENLGLQDRRRRSGGMHCVGDALPIETHAGRGGQYDEQENGLSDS